MVDCPLVLTKDRLRSEDRCLFASHTLTRAHIRAHFFFFFFFFFFVVYLFLSHDRQVIQ